MKTRTGSFPIGFRRGRGWQEDLPALVEWAVESGFEAIDLGIATREDVATVRAAGLSIGSCDLLDWTALFSKDNSERLDAVARNGEYLSTCLDLGVQRFFLVVIPKDKSLPIRENLEIAAASLGELARGIEPRGGMIVLEGWPGPWPEYGNLCCNPETVRWILDQCRSKGLGINYDPSHLVRLGIDPVRFLHEFLPHVGHVHAKDTELLDERLYEIGLYQKSAFESPFHCGEFVWRYTIPGHGCVRWIRILESLGASNWQGIVCVELEDHSFHGTPEADQAGYVASLEYLSRA